MAVVWRAALVLEVVWRWLRGIVQRWRSRRWLGLDRVTWVGCSFPHCCGPDELLAQDKVPVQVLECYCR